MPISDSLSLFIKLWKSDVWGLLDFWRSQHPAAHQVQVGGGKILNLKDFPPHLHSVSSKIYVLQLWCL